MVIMEINSCCVENTHSCLWFKDYWFYVEDMKCHDVLPMKILQLVWFEDQSVNMMQLPKQTLPKQTPFYNQLRNECGMCRIQKFKFDSRFHVELVVGPPTGGRRKIVIAVGIGKSGWIAF